ncbi:MAG: hypothetical protein M1821_002765 [Bathelium mastoideum]|nr:MAG: hypothetical protein M1821_002765 [Bathelium mastoideum]
MCIPAAPAILRDLHSDNSLYSTILVSIWELGEAFGPLLTAPLSELYGRAPVYNAANVVFIAFSIACAVSSNLPMLVAFRFFNGLGDASITLNPSIVGEMFVTEERGLPIALVMLPPLVGPVAGPIIGGYLTQAEGWRWAFWLSAITGAVCELGFLAVFRETYTPTILKRKSKRLRKETGNMDLKSKYDDDLDDQPSVVFRKALVKPVQMMVQSPIVLMLAAYVSVVYGFLYILLTTIVEVFEGTYEFNQGQAGLAYLGLSLGMVIGVLLCASTLDRWTQFARRWHKHHRTDPKPEDRLPPMVIGGIIIPIGLFIYGWTAEYHVFYIVPMIGTAALGFGFFVTTIPTSAYLVDAYKQHSASAIAATIVSRCIVGAVVPLAGPPLYAHLGLGWGNSLLGFIALLFVPVPLIFMFYGHRIRARATINVVD